jgi:hypothetical protein
MYYGKKPKLPSWYGLRFEPYRVRVKAKYKTDIGKPGFRKCGVLVKPLQRSVFRTDAGELMDFQADAVIKLAAMRQSEGIKGGILNFATGSGKTPTSLVFAQQFKWNVLYMCPQEIVDHVKSEIDKHFKSLKLRVCVVTSSSTPGATPSDIVILGYYTALRLKDRTLKILENRQFTTLILDEIQHSISPKMKVILETGLGAQFVLGLTAMENVIRKKPILQVARVTLSKQCIVYDNAPKFKWTTRYLEMSEKARAFYRTIVQKCELPETSKREQNKLVNDAWKMFSLEKIQPCLDAIQEIPPFCKTMIVARFPETVFSVTERILRYYALEGKHEPIKRKFLTLSKNIPERKPQLNQFENDPMCNILFATLTQVHEGHNFGFVDCMICVDEPYKIQEKKQLAGILRRIGQAPKFVNPQEILGLVVKGGSDEKLFNSNNPEAFFAKHGL